MQKKTKLRRQSLDEIAKKEKKISLELVREYFGYSSPSDTCKALIETKNLKKNRVQVNAIENRLTNLIKTLKCGPINDVKKNKKRNMLEIVELILYFS